MAHFRKSFPSRFMQSSDLDDGPITVTINAVREENLGTTDKPETKPVAEFKEEGVKPVSACGGVKGPAQVVRKNNRGKVAGLGLRYTRCGILQTGLGSVNIGVGSDGDRTRGLERQDPAWQQFVGLCSDNGASVGHEPSPLCPGELLHGSSMSFQYHLDAVERCPASGTGDEGGTNPSHQ